MRIGYGWLMMTALSVGAIVGFASPHAPETRIFGKPERLARISDLDVRESSGVAPSRAVRGEYLTHNDSGDSGRYFRFNLKGEVTAEVAVQGAGAFDWEDMESSRLNGVNYVYLADIGDNAEKRKSIEVYRVIESSKTGKYETSKFDKYTLNYPDSPHNCEAFMVDPQNGDFYLVTKVKKGAGRAYRLSAPKKAGSYTLAYLGNLEVGTMIPFSQTITAGDFAPDGRHVLLRTYSASFEFKVPKNRTRWWATEPTRIEMPVQDQGEAVCYSLDSAAIIATSEGKNCPIDRVRITQGKR